MGDYNVGYGRPPRQHQFKKGVCANPAGRGKKAIFSIGGATRKKLDEMVSAEVRGRTVRMSRKEAFLMQTIVSAAKGDVGDAGLILQIYEAAERSGDVGEIIVRVFGGCPD